ncbi:unnamed protein product, partial [Vitis vinifera]
MLDTCSRVIALSLSNFQLLGSIPDDLGMIEHLRNLDLSNNAFNGSLPLSLFNASELQVMDLSNNLISGELPEVDGGLASLQLLNLSDNALAGRIPDYLKIPEANVLYNQQTKSFSGNTGLCGKPLKAPSMPKTIDSTPVTSPGTTNGSRKQDENGLRPATIVGIVLGDIVGVGILAVIFLYDIWSSSSSSSETRGVTAWSCLPKRGDEEDSTETTGSDGEEEQTMQTVTVDGEKELELETLLKASAYILGATGSSIMYKAVLEDGTTLAVRRIGESGVERFRDFENQVKVIAKLVHPNLVRIRGFYWGVDEKLVIYDFVPNGSLASARYRKVGSSPCHMPWEVRLKVAKGAARGLTYLHDKKHVHGNLKPSNILLGIDMEPKIGDFGLERLVSGETSYKAGGSARNFGSKRSTASRDSFQDMPVGPSPSPSPSSLGVSPYHAPESLRSLKPNPKWDVFSFGVILLELLTGKVIVSDDLGLGLASEDKGRVLRMADAAIRADLEGKEDALLACFKLGFSCVSPAPQKRPSMKEAVQVLEKIPSSSSSSSYYAH